MTGGQTTYNERSWAIDLIGHLKSLVRSTHKSVRDVGGEQTVKGDDGVLYPDVLLFGDPGNAVILQGWELKMPDTGIDDDEFYENARTKAESLGLNSFVLWNVTIARLYARAEGQATYSVIEEWDDLHDVAARGEVKPAQPRWEAVAEAILDRVNELFETGELQGRPFIEAYRSGGPAMLVLANDRAVAAALKAAATRKKTLKSAVTLWWDRYGAEYGGGDSHLALAQANLINWVGKLLFAQILRGRDKRAAMVGQIGDETTPVEALALFEAMSRACNFYTIFGGGIGLSVLTDLAWSHLRQFNNLLSDLNVAAVGQDELSGILEAAAAVGRRKLRGQYTTPEILAKLLVELAVQDSHGRVLDPCCGSGTIARAALEKKIADGLPPAHAAASVFAGDRDPQSAQIATFALAKPALMSVPLRLFVHDAFDLSPKTKIALRDPNDGTAFTEALGTFHAITSNLPFVAQEGRKLYGDAIAGVNARLDEDMNGRADVAAYLPFALHPLLDPGGRLGVIITNSWLGTAWGDEFRRRLGEFYHLRVVVTSGAGRWFRNSKVITNILVLERKAASPPTAAPTTAGGDETRFVVLKRPIDELADDQAIELTAAQIDVGQSHHDTLTIRSVKQSKLEEFAVLGLAGNAQFVDVGWVPALPLVRLDTLFTVRRGERRGWDAMFYPPAGHGIEPEYLRPVLMSSSNVAGYTTSAKREAFSCSRSLDELKRLGHSGALAWIHRFASRKNGTGRPLPVALAKPGMHWYEMRADELTELFASINYGDRLYVGRLAPPAFVNQRLVRFDPIAGKSVSVDLCHALLNSTVGLFMLEGIGFGRGMGALDLNKDRIDGFLHLLDPSKLDDAAVAAVIAGFDPVRRRDIMDVAEELEEKDRRNFDETVLSAFGHADKLDRLYESLLNLVGIRQAANA